MNNSTKYKLIDLFCGCGGLTKGFWDTGRFDVVLANDNDQSAIKSYWLNFDPAAEHTECRDIIDLVERNRQMIPEADIVIGGPPCQGFSLLNRNRIGDKRRELWQYYIEVVRVSNASVVVMENVPQLMDSPKFSSIIIALRKLGFKNIMGHVLNAANFGVPEIRKRTILIAAKDKIVALPIPSHLAKDKIAEIKHFSGYSPDPWLTVRDAIGDLPVGAYVLESLKQMPEHDRAIPDAIRCEVLERDNFCCVECGWNYTKSNSADPRHNLELHHIKHHAKGGENTAANLVTLCNVCHDHKHTK